MLGVVLCDDAFRFGFGRVSSFPLELVECNSALVAAMEKKEFLVRHFQNQLSPTEFASIEDANVPAVFEGCVRSCPAYRLWDPSKGGLQRLKHLAGPATVQVMATTSGKR